MPSAPGTGNGGGPDLGYPPIGRLLPVGGGMVHALTTGSGPDVVLLHGASGNLRDFTFDLVGRLARDFRVTAFDRPGLGHSDPLHADGESPAEQAAVLDAAAGMLGLGRAVIVGHSFGGSVAMAWALEHPERVAAVVTLAGATMPWPGDLGPWYRIASTTFGAATVVPLVSGWLPDSYARNSVASIFAPQQPPDGYLEHVGIPLTLRRAAVLRSNVRQVAGLKPHVAAMARRYPGLSVPVEIVHGTADTIVPAAVHAHPMSRLLPTARLTELPGIGHMPHHVAPDATLAAIRSAAVRAGLN
ncbi:alpha/beta fold hydrolase [Tropicimonas sediminicola]|uniref:Pimeloyl-ACP methyl ester carboxylesterase n=1 Tax=Tropicimonas sediminicola TaxID=1031541 RepID=A0A239ED01_9RHOB|nr:alpha/beta hydrolase [Tropicimonas sediminicola]SNS41893.1 Pimeloyl-ACP methyl ester carboxylesterase [Tropicimonas sediminicola]